MVVIIIIIIIILSTPLNRYEYLQIADTLIKDDNIQQYNLLPLIRNWIIYLDIHKGMCGLSQSGRLAKDLLTECLPFKVYFQCTQIPLIWIHKLYPILFSLVVENFGVKYVSKEHSDHLISDIKELYPVAEDWVGRLYYSITLNWDYRKTDSWYLHSRICGGSLT